MLGVGIDWAEEFHLVALGRPGQGVVEVARVAHTPSAVASLVARIGGLEPDPDRVRVVIETSHGMLVEALLDAGWAFCSLTRSVWAREFYDTQISRGKSHHTALRALGNRWLEVWWHCVTTNTPYDEAVHVANRARAHPRPQTGTAA